MGEVKSNMAKERGGGKGLTESEWLFTDISEIGFVVPDMMMAVKEYCDVYGVGPWKIYDMGEAIVSPLYLGKEEPFQIKMAIAQVADVLLKLIEPVKGNSVYKAFLDKYGAGLQHVRVVSEKKAEELIRAFEAPGCKTVQTYSLKDGGKVWVSDHMDSLGFMFEVAEDAAGEGMPEKFDIYPNKDSKSVFGFTLENPMIQNIFQISTVVADYVAAAKECYDYYGIGPWAFLRVDENNAAQVLNHGRPACHRSMEAVQFIGKMNINFQQPLEVNYREEGKECSTFWELFEKYGTRTHHICLDCVNGYEGAMNILEAYSGKPAEFNCIMDGCEPVAFVNRMETLGTFFEIKCIPRGYTKPVLIGSYPKNAASFDY